MVEAGGIMNRPKGFSLIELILIITILGVMFISWLPKFLELSAEANQLYCDGIVSAVRSGIALYQTNSMIENGSLNYPASLDFAKPAPCSVQNTCFANILYKGVDDSSWAKKNANTYTYDNGSAIVTYIYDPSQGTFNKTDN
jgi:competence protein ComGC